LSAKLLPTPEDKGCRAVSATDPCGYILGFEDGKDGEKAEIKSQLLGLKINRIKV
jgi:hypothetical protein